MSAPTIEALAAELAQVRAENADLRKANRDLYTETTHDELTGLLNRKGVAERWALDEQIDYQFALALLDVDSFKLINDTYGHPAGDEVLRTIARDLADRWHIAGRRSGDELLIIDGRYELGTVAGVDRLPVWEVELPGGPTIGVSASIGITRAVDPLPLTLARADLALYRSKRTREVCWWDLDVDGDPVIVDRQPVRRRDLPVGAA